MDHQNEDSSKIYKIKYQINLLPKIGVHREENKGGNIDNNGMTKLVNANIDWMEMLEKANELAIFKSKAVVPFV